MRRRLIRETAFLLWRAAVKLDAPYMVLVAKTLARLTAATDDGAIVRVEVARPLAERLDDWSEPVQIRFAETTAGWVMCVRACESQVAISETIRARAARQ